MKMPWRWITEFVETPLAPGEAADRLVNAGVEVAGVAPAAPDLRGVVVGAVEAIERDLGVMDGHRLVVARVSTGAERFAVVCGAPNCLPGIRAAFAPPGAVLPGGKRIETTAVRGATSQGMLCSERDLGLGEDHAGVLVVDAAAPPGADLVAHLGLDDHVLDIEITPNRIDCLSVVGIARELAALTGAAFRPPRVAVEERGPDVETLARVLVHDAALCPRYAARVVEAVRVAPSPPRLAARLRAVGLRPISNVVDVTNYVLWELGQPLHAFDHDTVRERTIVVRRAAAGERLTTLDGQDRTLDDAMLVIADPARAIGIAGVMGGANTEVAGGTTRVLLEAAYFHAPSIRRTSRALGLRTDAAYRFERGGDIAAPPDALDRAAQLMVELAGGRVARGTIDVYPAPRPRPRIRLRASRVERVIGLAPPPALARDILVGLGLEVRQAGPDLDVEVPTFRRDLGIEDDLVEEVIRVWGYDKIPSTVPGGLLQPVRRPATLGQAELVRRALVAAGLSEVITLSFADPAHERALGRDPRRPEVLALVNPISQEASLLRPDLVGGLLQVVATNLRHRQPDVRIFEVGRQFTRIDGQPAETRSLGIALTGARRDPAWYARPEPVDLFDAKGLVEHALAALGVAEIGVDPGGARPCFEEGRWGRLRAGDQVVAEFGEIAAPVREAFGVPAPVFVGTVALDRVAACPAAGPGVVPLPRYPAIQRDLAFAVPASVPAARVEEVLRQEAGPHLRSLVMFDLYTAEGMVSGDRSIAWRLTFRADDRTLTDAEVSEIHRRLVEAVKKRLDIQIRGAE
jgi:phenylalanyl-tRNA synthetase beta chain